MDVYKEIHRLQLEGVTSQRTAAKRLGISRNKVKKYLEGDNVPWDHKPYNRDVIVMTPAVVEFVKDCLDEDDAFNIKRQQHTARRIYQRLVEERSFTGSASATYHSSEHLDFFLVCVVTVIRCLSCSFCLPSFCQFPFFS